MTARAAGSAPGVRGIAAVEGAFAKKPALIPYLVAGYPDLDRSRDCIRAAIEAGADMIEVGVPFSDPVADGKVIQAAGEVALANGMTLRGAIDLVAGLRRETATPMLLMSYFNPIYSMGVGRFIDAAVAAGVDGAIIPDLIPDEAWGVIQAARKRDFALVFLAAPNAPESRLAQIASASSGFIYGLGLEGVTGERKELNDSLAPFIARLRAAVRSVPDRAAKAIAVGFGVSNREHFAAIGAMADGVIVGSAVVRRSSESPAAVGRFLRELRG